MIEVTNLTKAFPGTVAVDDISFHVERGEIVGFLGPNGAGKSTTMRMLSCFIPITRGSVRVAGFDVVRQSLEVRRRVGYLPESNPLYTEMRVREYLKFRAGIKKVVRANRNKRVDAVIDRCGLGERAGSIIGHLSKGYRQRVGLADAIIHEPELVILDEPTQGLDPGQVREVRKLIRELSDERTVMLSTHILSEVEAACGRVMIINRGKLVAEGSPKEIAGKLVRKDRYRLEAKGEPEAIRKTLEELSGVERVSATPEDGTTSFVILAEGKQDLRPQIFQLASKNNWDLLELAYDRGSLEDAFVELTAQKEATDG